MHQIVNGTRGSLAVMDVREAGLRSRLWKAAAAGAEQRNPHAETAASAGLRGEIREPGVTVD
jgi:hypothetical protein